MSIIKNDLLNKSIFNLDENDFGMMVSLNTPIATKPHLTRDRTLNKHKLLMYLSFENMTEEQAVAYGLADKVIKKR